MAMSQSKGAAMSWKRTDVPMCDSTTLIYGVKFPCRLEKGHEGQHETVITTQSWDDPAKKQVAVAVEL